MTALRERSATEELSPGVRPLLQKPTTEASVPSSERSGDEVPPAMSGSRVRFWFSSAVTMRPKGLHAVTMPNLGGRSDSGTGLRKHAWRYSGFGMDLCWRVLW
jgi:hypothetical protein